MKINQRVILMRESISTIVAMLSGKKIKVTQRGSRAYVDYNPTTLEVRRVNLPFIPDDATDELLDAIQGFLDHEVAHVLFTDSTQVKRAKMNKVAGMANILEDCYIERRMTVQFRGSAANLERVGQFVLDTYTTPSLAAQPGRANSILLMPMMRAWSGQTAFKDFMADKWDLVKDLVARMGPDMPTLVAATKSSTDCTDLAIEVKRRLAQPPKPKPKPKPPEPPEEKEEQDEPLEQEETGDSPGEGEEGSGDDADPATPADDIDLGDEPDGTEKPNEAGIDLDDQGNTDKEEGDDDEEGDGEEDGEGDLSDETDELDGQEPKGDEPEVEGDSEGEPDGEKDAEGPTDSDSEADNEPADTEAKDKTDTEEEKGADLGADGDTDADVDAEVEGDSDESDSGDQDEAPASKPVEEEDEGDGASLGGDGDRDDESDEGEGEEEGEGGDSEGESDEPVFDFDEMEKEGAFKDFDEIAAEAISKDAAAAIKSATYTVYSKDFDIIEPLEVKDTEGAQERLKTMQEKVDGMVGVMQKDMERIMQARSQAVWTGGHKSGRLHGAGLARLHFGREDVFRRKQVSTSKDVAVEILVDASGSMGMGSRGNRRIDTAAYTAYALSSVLQRMGIVHEVMAFTTKELSYSIRRELRDEANRSGVGTYSRQEALWMPILKSFNEKMDSKVKERMVALQEEVELRENVDGECLQIAAMRLSRRRESRKILMVLSDGSPMCADGDLEEQSRHLADVAKAIESRGQIDLIGIGIQTAAVRSYYKHHVVLNNLKDLPGDVMLQLKQLLFK